MQHVAFLDQQYQYDPRPLTLGLIREHLAGYNWGFLGMMAATVVGDIAIGYGLYHAYRHWFG